MTGVRRLFYPGQNHGKNVKELPLQKATAKIRHNPSLKVQSVNTLRKYFVF